MQPGHAEHGETHGYTGADDLVETMERLDNMNTNQLMKAVAILSSTKATKNARGGRNGASKGN